MVKSKLPIRWILTTLILSLPYLNCCAQGIQNDEVNEVDGTRAINTKPMEVGTIFSMTDFIDISNEVLTHLSYSKDKKGLEIFAINFAFEGSKTDFGCLSEQNGKAVILFENDSTLEVSQSSETDCSGTQYFASYVLLSKGERENKAIYQDIMRKNFARLSANKVKKIRVYGSKGYHDYTIKPEKLEILSLHAKAIQQRIDGK